MPTLWHEVMVQLLRDEPRLAVALAGRLVPMPRSGRARLEPADFAQPVAPAMQADAAVRLVDRHGRPRMGLVVEVQLAIDRRKWRSWPLYVASLHARLGCAAYLLVLAPDRHVAGWARRPITTFQPNAPFVPLVLGPDEIPRVVDVAAARQSPQLALLSALVHAHDAGSLDVALAGMAAADALRRIDAERAAFYHEVICQKLGARLLAELERAMQVKGFEFKSAFARKHRAEGRVEGRVEGRGDVLLKQLELRFGPPSPEVVARVRQADTATLDRWVEQILTAASAAELFAASAADATGGEAE
jgi:hypothetical protein